jgi:hypothetical protein
VCGLAIDVPLTVAYVFAGQLDRTSAPGAATFGFIWLSSRDGPREEKDAMTSLLSVAPLANDSG